MIPKAGLRTGTKSDFQGTPVRPRGVCAARKAFENLTLKKTDKEVSALEKTQGSKKINFQSFC